jgi:type VI protein secretion system component VasK
MFIMWNMDDVSVVGFVSPMDPDQGYAVTMPQAFLAAIGVLIGVVVMGIAAWGTWAAQRDAARQSRRQLAVAKQKLEERTDMVRTLRAELGRFKNTYKNASENEPEEDVDAE